MGKLWISFLLAAFSPFSAAQAPLVNAADLEVAVRAAYVKATAGINAPTIAVDAVLPHLVDGSLIFVDVRKDAEIAVSQIPGALSVDQFNQRYKSAGPPKGTTVVAYCTIGYRSGKFAQKLVTRGVPVRNLEGGILAWVGKQGPLVQRGAAGAMLPTTAVHVYDREWNLVPSGYQAVW